MVLHICCQAQGEPPTGVNFYAAVAYQWEKASRYPYDEAYSWVDNLMDIKTLHEKLANPENLLWLDWQKIAETAYSTSEISKANTFEEAKTAIYKAADSSSMSGINREHVLLLLHEIWERRGSFLDRFEIEKEYDRLITDYILVDVVSNLENFFDIDEIPKKMLEWAAANPFNIKRKDTEQLYELMWRAWRQRSAGLTEKNKKALFLYQVRHARKMYREHLTELKVCGKGVNELKEFVCKNEARFETSALVEYQKKGEDEVEASWDDKQERVAEEEHNDVPDESAPSEKQPE